ncbi:uncharacterized protein LOC105914941 [Setaria italica]|uniref:uncharacterized protein LOC105914941 n=1 Tax=Setaria italica TaxID=4555 RepID=UPI0006474B2C|nr:uncharacterized protein LOC105914941 [Setaria italica]
MADDIDYVLQKRMGSSSYSVPDSQVIVSSSGFGNRLIDDGEAYDIATLVDQAPLLYSRLNDCERAAYDSIVRSVMGNEPAFYFVSHFGDTGTMFLWNNIITYVRSLGKIVLAVTSSGVASLLLSGGRTAHSIFKILIDIDETTICDIKRALDHSLHDIMSENNADMGLLPFGGMVVVLGGDLRQLLPIVEGGVCSKIVDAEITNSPLWRSIIVLELTMNMRLVADGLDSIAKEELSKFSDWVLSVGDGTLPTVSHAPKDDGAWVQIPDDMLVVTTTDDRIRAAPTHPGVS